MEGIENNQMPLAHCDHVLKTVLCHAEGSIFIQSLQIEMPNLKNCCLNMIEASFRNKFRSNGYGAV
jgi:hypothetical protein